MPIDTILYLNVISVLLLLVELYNATFIWLHKVEYINQSRLL